VVLTPSKLNHASVIALWSGGAFVLPWPHRLTSRAILGYNIPVVPTGLTISFYDRFVIIWFL
jgi:hypothetical protein